jgi:anthranilate phosphoribosyltransferase
MDTVILNKLIQKKDLTTDEAKTFLIAVMKAQVSPVQIGAVLTALAMKGETEQETLGFIQAMREYMVTVSLPDAIDVCGTGGDGSRSFNISTAVAFVVAACGVPVAKHGNRAASSTCGSADVLEELGVKIDLTPTHIEQVYKKTGMVFLFAPLFHPATKQVAMVRKELKIRTIFNVLGPFLNPSKVTRQLIGVPNIGVAKKMIRVAKHLQYKHLLLVTSTDGMDEISLFAKSYVFSLKNKRLKQFVIDPKQYDFKKATKKDIEEGTLSENAKYIQDIFNGVKNAKRDIVVLNSAAVLYVADKVSHIESGIQLAQQAIDSGAAKKVLHNLIKETQKYA